MMFEGLEIDFEALAKSVGKVDKMRAENHVVLKADPRGCDLMIYPLVDGEIDETRCSVFKAPDALGLILKVIDSVGGGSGG